MQIARLDCNPIITPETHQSIGDNINGPSLITAPEWLENPLGRYYLYFAHHKGEHIRLACADDLCGPWEVYEPGVMRLDETVCHGHVASPDVHIDDGRLRMYFHGPTDEGQKTFAATSTDGLHFDARPEVLGPSYFRVFEWANAYYAIARDGCVYRSEDPLAPFEQGQELFENLRHCAVRIVDSTLQVFYSNVGDTPERIVLSNVNLDGDWRTWSAGDEETILRPEQPWEGADLPIQTSEGGWASEPVHELRDPAIYEEDGRTWLVYSIAGENGLAVAEIMD